jgi:hypothetical protein
MGTDAALATRPQLFIGGSWAAAGELSRPAEEDP